jgi:hypothetical protein
MSQWNSGNLKTICHRFNYCWQIVIFLLLFLIDLDLNNIFKCHYETENHAVIWVNINCFLQFKSDASFFDELIAWIICTAPDFFHLFFRFSSARKLNPLLHFEFSNFRIFDFWILNFRKFELSYAFASIMIFCIVRSLPILALGTAPNIPVMLPWLVICLFRVLSWDLYVYVYLYLYLYL